MAASALGRGVSGAMRVKSGAHVAAKDLITNELIDGINKFDPNQIAAAAKDYKVR